MDETVAVEHLDGVCGVVLVKEHSDFFTDKLFFSLIEDIINSEGAVFCNYSCFFPAKQLCFIDMFR